MTTPGQGGRAPGSGTGGGGGGVTPAELQEAQDAASSDCLVFKPGGADVGPVVFNNFATLMARFDAMRAANDGGCYQLGLSDLLIPGFAGLDIPAGAWDMTGIEWVPGDFSDQTVFVNVLDGASFIKLRRISGRIAITSQATTSPVSDFATTLELLVIANGVSVQNAVGAAPFFDFTSVGGAGFAQISFSGANTAIGGGAGGTEILATPAGSTLAVLCDAASGIPQNSISGPVGATVDINGTADYITGPQPAFLGTLKQKVFGIGPMGNVVPVPPLPASVVPIAAFFSNSLMRFDASGGPIVQLLPLQPVAGGQAGGQGRRIVMREESGSPGLSVVPAGANTINGGVIPVQVPPGGSVTFLGDGANDWRVESISQGLALFGASYQTAQALARTTTAVLYPATTQKLALVTPANLHGTYRVGWQATIDNAATNSSTCVQLEEDGVIVGTVKCERPRDASDRQTQTGFAEIVLAGVSKTLSIEFATTNAANLAGCEDAAIELWRVG